MLMISNDAEIKDPGETKQCLAVRIIKDYNNSCVTLNQEDYMDQISRKFNMVHCTRVSTLTDNNLCFDDHKDSVYNEDISDQRLVSNLMYLTVLT